MSFLVPPRRFDPAVPEMMDRRGNDATLLRADLRVLEKINHYLGGYRIPLSYLTTFAKKEPMTILDLGTGAADVPGAIARWAKTNRRGVQLTGVDRNPEILQIARENVDGWPEIRLEQADLLHLPYRPNSFDFVLCSLTLHHFSEGEVVAILRRIHDIARGGYIINDLRRNRIAIALSKIMAQTVISNPIARFDAPASCERAFTPAELRDLAGRAGLSGFSIRQHPFFRMSLVGHK
ncbi:MAG TPA: methyltransferase domain-containing protein [Verrucomicrobiae bacterium]|nr:methyltransferase domain-containing protein [Verrucomicrobiae bacterium]